MSLLELAAGQARACFPVEATDSRSGRAIRTLAGVVAGIATPLAILGIAAVILVSPPVFHVGLDVAGSAGILGLSGPETYRASDLTVTELVVGPATFAFSVPAGGQRFYDPAEASHLRDVRVVLAGFATAFGLAFGVLAVGVARRRREAWLWRAVARGARLLVVSLAALGVLLLVAFDPLFTLFHLVFFPGGNWAFDPTTERMVQLYPTAFWEYAAAVLAVVGIGVGVVAWWFAARRARRLDLPIRESSRRPTEDACVDRADHAAKAAALLT